MSFTYMSEPRAPDCSAAADSPDSDIFVTCYKKCANFKVTNVDAAKLRLILVYFKQYTRGFSAYTKRIFTAKYTSVTIA
jgi:hypothetical protein